MTERDALADLRDGFIHGYYVAKIESLMTTLQHVAADEVDNIRDKILLSAAELWDSLLAEAIAPPKDTRQ